MILAFTKLYSSINQRSTKQNKWKLSATTTPPPSFPLISFNLTVLTLLQFINYTNSTTKAVVSTFSTVNETSWPTIANVCIPEVIDQSLIYYSLPYRIMAGLLIVPITICAIGGNILVIYVIKHFQSLRITGNVFLASLAVADVGVSTTAMTFYGLQLLTGKWILGAFMCRLWFSCDVLFSTASINHLTCISLDRYLSIVRPFEHKRSSSERRRWLMIALCWILSCLLSFIPIFTGIYTSRSQIHDINCLNKVTGRCLFIVNQIYAIVSSCVSFWVPGAVMVIMYAMLIRIADAKEREVYKTQVHVRRRTSNVNAVTLMRRLSEENAAARSSLIDIRTSRNQLQTNNNNNQTANNRRITHSESTSQNMQHQQPQRDRDRDRDADLDTPNDERRSIDIAGNLLDPGISQVRHLKRERRAVKTLGAIMIAFIVCWLPFFVRYSACEPNRCRWKYMPIVEDLVFWIGYFNSCINPFLYAFHNKDFRNAFQKTLGPFFSCFCRFCRERRQSINSATQVAINAGLATTGAGNPSLPAKKRKVKKKRSVNNYISDNVPRAAHSNGTSNNLNGGGENSSSSKRNSCT
ncbi:unnamed protein product [Didymodactylos carnosus]|uniref:G-protein coupled receptors family 1 profile domain-containing protein n=1 Tax=Didymodactylos carnosus TaxID=1234261 RepID=A0A814F1Y0_9BILA|nr:unnamed protein product [Didymodactylos carnosus]CAF1235374.1 unnamed protein product [Didymodactylos carnosus]CAF3748410.1 unnamed protein product [Didymodactylos carnosus]CAF4043236.1 unnamed protein product [Didymodactylos carnosus]